MTKKGDEVIIERDGRVVARVLPRREVTLESMRGRLNIVGDIVAPLDEPWEACSPRRTLEEMRGSVKILGDIVGPVNDPEDWDAMK